MKIYIMLPFTNTVYLDDYGGKSANLTEDYAANFEMTGRYKFKSIDITDFKRPSFGNPEKSYRWVYTILNPKTLSLHQ